VQMYKIISTTPDYICYDDACHLRKFARNSIRSNLTSQSTALASVEMVVDKMHMKGHVDPWCKENCDANKFKELHKVCDACLRKPVMNLWYISCYRLILKCVNKYFLGYLSILELPTKWATIPLFSLYYMYANCTTNMRKRS